MKLSENAEELLEALQVYLEKGEKSPSLKEIGFDREDNAVQELLHREMIEISANRSASLTPKGRSEGENVIRRHRLAERLLADVLSVESAALEEAACGFEHVIRDGIENNVCTLLGHPRVCPHGNPIPEGKCCLKGDKQAEKIVVPLPQMELDHEGRIAYIRTDSQKEVRKLMGLGVVPGKHLRLIEEYPSYVFQIGQTQIAVDEQIASQIFLVRTSS